MREKLSKSLLLNGEDKIVHETRSMTALIDKLKDSSA